MNLARSRIAALVGAVAILLATAACNPSHVEGTVVGMTRHDASNRMVNDRDGVKVGHKPAYWILDLQTREFESDTAKVSEDVAKHCHDGSYFDGWNCIS
jgi:hypothetical protein